jgi:DNA-binding HxlR family transcriptional regulator
MVDDIVTIALLTASAFFVVLSAVLLFRYRQVSSRIASANDLGKDLWTALEARMKKQDERILDMMGRVEVIQSRALQRLSSPSSMNPSDRIQIESESSSDASYQDKEDTMKPGEVTQTSPETSHVMPQPEEAAATSRSALENQLKQQDDHILGLIEQMKSLESRFPVTTAELPIESDQTHVTLGLRSAHPQIRESTDKVSEKTLLEMLREKPRTSVEIRERFGITREHAARVLKELFDKGIVIRNDSHKPFVYELTELGRQASKSV